MKKTFFLFIIFFLLSAAVFGKDEKLKVSTEVGFALDSNDIHGDKYYLEYELDGILKAEYALTDRLSTILSIELDRYETDVDEISVLYEISCSQDIKGGVFDSRLTLNDFLKKRYEMFFFDAPGEEYIQDLGWVMFNNGIRYIHRDFLKDDLDIETSFFFNSSHNETQYFLTAFYNFERTRHFAAFTVSYLPFWLHRIIFGKGDEYVYNNFIFSGKYFRYTDTWVLAGEAALGNNLIDPIGFLHFPGEDKSLFASADFYLGRNLYAADFIYTPALRGGVLFPDIKYGENRRIEIMLGNFIRGKYIFFHLDGGIQFDTYDDGGGLVTDFEPVWGISFCIRS